MKLKNHSQPQSRTRTMRVAATATAAISLLIAAGPLSSETLAAAKATTDPQISTAVESEFIFDEIVTFDEVDVSSKNGIVTLTGTVDSLVEKERAGRLAETVRGVTAVANDLKVRSYDDRKPDAIWSDLKMALGSSAALEPGQVDAKVDANGAVTLTGSVDSWAEKEIAAEVAKGVRGVTAVQNDISVEFHVRRSDEEILNDVQGSLKWNALVDDGLIDIKVDDGVVHLSGTVASVAERREAIASAYVSGVISMDSSDLQVAGWSRDDELRKNKMGPFADEATEQAIRKFYHYEPRLDDNDVTVNAVAGIVTLRGIVDTPDARRAAEEIARRTTGVNSVRNHIRVRASDEAPAGSTLDKVRNALARDPIIERFGITAEVDGNEVHLIGRVDTPFERARAEDVVSGISGVASVENDLDVMASAPFAYDPYVDRYSPYLYGWATYRAPYYTVKPDQEIVEDINDEMWWSPFVDSETVDVEVDDGVATLTGTVESFSERTSAIENAYEGGATWVIDKLDRANEESGA